MPNELLLFDFEIPGVPPNWLNVSKRGIALHLAKAEWVSLAATEGYREWARRVSQLPVGGVAKESDQRRVQATIYRCKPLFDDDGASACLKPIIDGLKYRRLRRSDTFRIDRQMVLDPGPGLFYDDDPKHLIQEKPIQVPVAYKKDQRIRIQIWLVKNEHTDT